MICMHSYSSQKDRYKFQDRTRCLLKGNCLIDNVIYKAIIRKKEDNIKDKKLYIGATEMSWKNKWYNHILTLNKRKYANSTTLSKYVQ